MHHLRKDDLGRLRPNNNQVKAGVPAGEWCPGRHSKAERAASTESGGFFGKLFERC